MIWRCDLVPQYLAFKAEIDRAIQRVLRSGRYTLGDEVAAFEHEFAAYLGVRHVITVADGTHALTLSLKILGIGPDDEVITTPFTAFPTIGAILQSGAVPVFVDIDPDTFLLDLERVQAAVTPRTKAVVPVHIFGNVVDIARLRSVVEPDVAIVEDAAQAHGSRIRGTHAGAMGDLGVFSFYPTKNLGAYGDGGAIATISDAYAERLRRLRNHGLVDKDHCAEPGINSRLDELQAAVLRVKLRHLDEMNHARSRLAARYRSLLPSAAFRHQLASEGVEPNHHVFQSRYLGDRDALAEFLDGLGIQTNIYYVVPHHLQAAVRHLGYKKGDLPGTEEVCRQGIALPMYPELSDALVEAVAASVCRFVTSDPTVPGPPSHRR
ncbi:MAG: DegT/DnrJ/EryC1/StrS family aminotransferase [Candidatus Rokuibacteriota bacterium]